MNKDDQLALFESIIRFSDDAIITKTLDGFVTSWNRAAEVLFGFSSEEIVGRHISLIIPHERINEEQEIVEKIKEGKHIQHYETERKGKDGRIVFISLTVSPLKDKNGVITGASKIARDITRQKRAETDITKILEERNTILESIGDAFFAVDNNWVVSYWNNMAEHVLGRPRNEVLRKSLWEVYRGSVGTESYRQYHVAIETQRSVHFEHYYPPLHAWYEISAYPSNAGLSVYLKDVTAHKATEITLTTLNENLAQHVKELAISNAELEQFAYVASHDLQEPLRMVTSFLTQLEKKYSAIIDDRGRKYIYFAVDGAKRMRQIILDLLEFSRVGRDMDEYEEVDIHKLIKDILRLYKKRTEEEHARITFNNLPTVRTYKTPIRQVLQNLIGNSLKYHRQGEAPVISVSCEEKANHWEVAVTDNGIGINASYFDKIFIIFQRLHNKDEYSGTGMGLAIAKKIVEHLGGRIWVTSDEEKGSTFYFTILKNNIP